MTIFPMFFREISGPTRIFQCLHEDSAKAWKLFDSASTSFGHTFPVAKLGIPAFTHRRALKTNNNHHQLNQWVVKVVVFPVYIYMYIHIYLYIYDISLDAMPDRCTAVISPSAIRRNNEIIEKCWIFQTGETD